MSKDALVTVVPFGAGRVRRWSVLLDQTDDPEPRPVSCTCADGCRIDCNTCCPYSGSRDSHYSSGH